MMNKIILLVALFTVSTCVVAGDQVVISDDNITISKHELGEILKTLPDDIKREAAEDPVARKVYLNKIIASRKMAHEIDQVVEEKDQEFYWKTKILVQGLKIRMLLEDFERNLVVPDMSELAEEKYLLEKERYAQVKESRESSHILFLCQKGDDNCDKKKQYLLAVKVIEELDAGKEFKELVKEYSEDLSSKARDGQLAEPVSRASKGVSKRYIKGVFRLKSEGDYSAEPVATEFGYHIIRLDKINEAYFLPYEKVKGRILKSLEAEYRASSLQLYKQSFEPGEDAEIDNEVIDEILDPYKSEKP